MIMKNKKEREDFIKGYKSRGVWKEIPELNLKFYRRELPTGAVIIATEYIEFDGYKRAYETHRKFRLILPKQDEYTYGHTYGEEFFWTYTPNDTSLSTLVDYLTKNRDKIDI